MRNVIIDHIIALNVTSRGTHQDKHADAVQIELGVLAHSLFLARERNVIASWSNDRFRRAYIGVASNTIDTISRSDHVKREVAADKLMLRDIAALKPSEAFPEMWRESMAVVASRAEDAQRGPHPLVTTTLFKCSRCKQNKCTFREIQLRSADEPVTIFVNCLNCGHRWKQ